MSTAALWWITLGAGFLVVLVVAALLYAILVRTRRVTATLGEVWQTGQAVANNTAHIDLVRRSAVQAEEAAASCELSAQYVARLAAPARG